jgi:hypothetical protein
MSFNTATYAVETALLNYIFDLGYTFLKKNSGATSQLHTAERSREASCTVTIHRYTVRRHCTHFSRQGDLAFEVCASLFWVQVIYLFFVLGDHTIKRPVWDDDE